MNNWYKFVGAIPYNESVTSLWQEKYINNNQFFSALSAPFGIFLNLIVVYVSFIDKTFEGNFKFFLGNVAIVVKFSTTVVSLYGQLVISLHYFFPVAQ